MLDAAFKTIGAVVASFSWEFVVVLAIAGLLIALWRLRYA